MIYFISDTHFGHKGSLHWPNGNNRKFDSVEHMNQVIVDNWNNIVNDDDLVYHLGDFSYKASSHTIKHVMESLKGRIILIKGNHDGRTLKVNSQIHRFESIHDRVTLFHDNQYFILDHYPILSWERKSYGSIHLHGHVHEAETGIPGRIFNVSCENIAYTPISIDEIKLKFIA